MNDTPNQLSKAAPQPTKPPIKIIFFSGMKGEIKKSNRKRPLLTVPHRHDQGKDENHAGALS